jgi:protein-disulfide isomerase
MNTKRIFFWASFVIVLVLIVWGLIVAMNRSANPNGTKLGSPAPISAIDHVLGSSDMPVTLIEYSDFQCPACRTYYYLVKRLMSEASTTVRLVYRHFPLPQHANAILAAQASEAAGVQGKFWEMFALIFEKHDEWAELADPRLVFYGYADEIGLDQDKFKLDIDSATVKTVIANMQDEGRKLGINQTPTFFVNGKVIDNPSTYDEFKTLIQTATEGSAN